MNYEILKQKRAAYYKAARKSEGYTLKHLASENGVSYSTLSRYENGKSTNDKALQIYKTYFGEYDCC